MKRRTFIRNTLAGSALLAAFPYEALALQEKLYPHDRVKLGHTGIEMSRMAMGTGTHGFGGASNQTRQLGIKGVSDMLRAGFDEGINFCNEKYKSDNPCASSLALKKVNREEVVILTKTNSSTYEDVKKDLDRFRIELGTDYLDIILLHAVTDPQWNQKMKGAMEALAEAKEEGIIRTHGVSCHSIGALETAADEPWVEVDLARFNPGGARMDSDVETVQKVLTRMKDNDKAIIAMKVYGCGELLHIKDECLQFQTGTGLADAFTMGFESIEQLKDIQKRLPEASIRA